MGFACLTWALSVGKAREIWYPFGASKPNAQAGKEPSMSENSQLIMWTNIYRIALLAVAVVFAILGAKLLEKGIDSPLAEGQATWGKLKITLKRVGPGVAYVVGAAAIVIVSIVNHPYSLTERTVTESAAPTEPTAPTPANFPPVFSSINGAPPVETRTTDTTVLMPDEGPLQPAKSP
jgi:hypothetical protein